VGDRHRIARPAPGGADRLLDPATVEVSVCDNGPGIPEAQLPKLFEPFYTTKATGMGMGLPVSTTIIEAHKGKLTAETRPDGGTCFRFTLQTADCSGGLRPSLTTPEGELQMESR